MLIKTKPLIKKNYIENYFESEETSYNMFLIAQGNLHFLLLENWMPPNGWTGPTPVVYRSFDSSHDLVCIERGAQSNHIPQTCGKVIT